MSTPKPQPVAGGEATESSIVAYLQAHPDFFEHHAALLAALRLPHQAGDGAVSLVERQVSVLRQKNLGLERKLKEFIDVARGNDQTAARIHALALRLVEATDRERVIRVLERELRVSFGADDAVLVLFSADAEGAANETRFLRLIARDDPCIAPFRTFLQSGNPRCGQIRDTQRDFLFGAGNVGIGSVALVPLGREASLGFLAIGNRDAAHFHPGQGLELLVRLGELVGCALSRPD